MPDPSTQTETRTMLEDEPTQAECLAVAKRQHGRAWRTMTEYAKVSALVQARKDLRAGVVVPDA